LQPPPPGGDALAGEREAVCGFRRRAWHRVVAAVGRRSPTCISSTTCRIVRGTWTAASSPLYSP
jgi:hypothetical protein